MNKSRFLFFVLTTLFLPIIAPPNEPLQIESNKQLFIGPFDEHGRNTHLVESMKNVQMTMNPAHVTGERLVAQDRPWAGTDMLDMRQFVLKDGDTFRMYYNGSAASDAFRDAHRQGT